MEYFNQFLNEENGFNENLPVVEKNMERQPTITRKEVVCPLQKMARGKASGPDEVVVEMFDCLGEMGIDWLHSLFQEIWSE